MYNLGMEQPAQPAQSEQPRQPITLDLIRSARQRIAPYVRHTPLLPAPLLHRDVPAHLHLKLENMQLTGSFKVRGALNTLLSLDAAQQQRGVVASSGGNHGLAVAYAAHRLGIPATIYLPATAAPDRVARIEVFGVRLIRHGQNWDDAHARALEHAAAAGLTYVHPFDAPLTLAGQGTLGLELLEDVPNLDCVLIAIGGGGLIAGMAAALKQSRPDIRIIGVEPTGAASMRHSLRHGSLVALPHVTTIADTLAPRCVGHYTLALAQQYVDEVVLVDDAALVDAMRWLWRECNQLVEPAAVATVAALHTGVAELRGATAPVALICGGNAAAGSVFDHYQAQIQT